MSQAIATRGYAATLVLLLLGMAHFAAQAQQTVPDWTLSSAGGEPLNFYTHSAGRPAVLLFWATWCPYCGELMPELEAVRREFASADVSFYALNIWADGDPLAHMREHNYGFNLLLDADPVAVNYGIKGTPSLIVVDAARRVVYSRKSGTPPARVASDLRAVLGQVTSGAD
jgi:thiol-disulfide isomerase/thioredoxin